MDAATTHDLQKQIERLRSENEQLRSGCFSQNKRLNKLLNAVVDEVQLYAEDQISHIRRLAKIGLALSAEKNLNKVLEMIVDEARSISNADAGTLYVVDKSLKVLRFEILQNDTLKTRIAATDEIKMPPIPLEEDGKQNYSNVSSYVALTGKIVNIPDVYEAEGFDFTGPRKYDASTGYRSKSMLVIPMKNHENDIIGVLQLLNAQEPESREVIGFSEEHVDLIASLASQAAITLTNTMLVQDLRNLFYAFIRSIATAIDEKSPYTGGHVRRVVDLVTMIANQIDEAVEGPFADVHFSEDELEELRVAAWLHDVGKIATPEYVVDKRTKLETIFDRIHLVKTRFALIREAINSRYLREKIELLESKKDGVEAELSLLDKRVRQELEILQEEMNLVLECNMPAAEMTEGRMERLEEIAQKTVVIDGRHVSYLTSDELYNLSIRRGSLTDRERKMIEQHAVLTTKILRKLPFPKKLSRVPEFASHHHERIDGSGYPSGISGGEIPLQARIIAMADVFEALTAKDRPYKRPLTLSRVVGIMEKDAGMDSDIFKLFMESRLYREYAERELSSEQIDDL